MTSAATDDRVGPDPELRSVTQRWIDSHCHVADADAVAEATDAGVIAMVTVGCDRASSLAAIADAAAHRDVYATVGLHPHEAVHGVDTIRDLLDTPGIVAVGEAGLDYFYDHSPRDLQAAAFAAQIELANELDLALVIHTRDAWDDTFGILRDVGVPARTILHCFTGGPDEARRGLELGALLSFSGIVTFKGAPEVQAAAAFCPLDRMLVETDSPYLAPAPHRGRPNRPAWVAHVGRFIADLRGLPAATLATATTANARAAFALPAH